MLPRVDGAEHLLTELRTALAGHFARMEKESVEDLCVSNIIRRPYSTVLFLTVKTDRHTRRLVAKRIVHHPENKAVSARENQAVVEFNILQHLYARFEPMPGCSVCRPVVVLPALETVVIEFVEGTLLADELGRADASDAIPRVVAAGASGAIFGVFGALGVFYIVNRRALGAYGTGAISNWIFWLP